MSQSLVRILEMMSCLENSVGKYNFRNSLNSLLESVCVYHELLNPIRFDQTKDIEFSYRAVRNKEQYISPST